MAISTQIRLAQLTGSLVDTGLETPTLTADSLQGVQDALASAVKRITGGTSFTAAKAGVFDHAAPEFKDAGIEGLKIIGAASGPGVLKIEADASGDDGDKFQISVADGTGAISMQSFIGGSSYKDILKLTPNATPADSLVEAAGLIKVGGNKVQNSAAGDSIVLSGDGTNHSVQLAGGTGKVKIAGDSIEGQDAGDLSILSVSDKAILISAGTDGTADADLKLNAGDQLYLRDQFSEDARAGGKLTAAEVVLASSAAEWNEFGDSFTAGSSIIGAINKANSGAPAGILSFANRVRTTGAQASTLGLPDRMVVQFSEQNQDAGAKLRIPLFGRGKALPDATLPSECEVQVEYGAADSGGLAKRDDNATTKAARLATLLTDFEPRKMVVTFGGNPVNNETVLIKNGVDESNVTFTAKTSAPGANEFLIVNGDNNAMAVNLAAAINANVNFQAFSAGAAVHIYKQVQPRKDAIVSITSSMTGLTLTTATPADTGTDIIGTCSRILVNACRVDNKQNGAVSAPFALVSPNNNGFESIPLTEMVGGGASSKYQAKVAGGDSELKLNTAGFAADSIVSRVDVYLNGQLLVSASANLAQGLSGSAPFGPASGADYILEGPGANTPIIFGFDLEADDTVQLKIR